LLGKCKAINSIPSTTKEEKGNKKLKKKRDPMYSKFIEIISRITDTYREQGKK
jgi:vacuolar-type H+-ATPase subunit D/Vma8